MRWLKTLKIELNNSRFTNLHDENHDQNKDLGEAAHLCEINSESFTIRYKSAARTIHWIDISKIRAFKSDLITVDRIGLEIFCEGNAYLINEDLPGWETLCERLKSAPIEISEDWKTMIMFPPFVESSTIIYSHDVKG